MPTKQTKKSKYRNRPSKQVARTKRIKRDDWRYVPYIPELLDTIHNHNPEDEWISSIDGEFKYQEPDFDYHQVLNQYLPEEAAEVVDMYLGQGKTFQEIADYLGCSRQWANKVYHKALSELRPHLETYNLPTQKPIHHKVEMNLHLRTHNKIKKINKE